MTRPDVTHVRDHWYWRPGWHIGARFYTWHITFSDQPGVVELAEHYRNSLSNQSSVDVVPPEWLHLTMQGVGFVDQINRSEVDAIVEKVRVRCAGVSSFELSIGMPHIDPESIQIAVQPADPVRALRTAIRAGIGDVWGVDQIPEPAGPFNPHLSLAYINTDGPARPLADAVNNTPPFVATAAVSACQLIILNRDNGMYQWEPYATVQIGQ